MKSLNNEYATGLSWPALALVALAILNKPYVSVPLVSCLVTSFRLFTC
jgi:hypothetical protein